MTAKYYRMNLLYIYPYDEIGDITSANKIFKLFQLHHHYYQVFLQILICSIIPNLPLSHKAITEKYYNLVITVFLLSLTLPFLLI